MLAAVRDAILKATPPSVASIVPISLEIPATVPSSAATSASKATTSL